jgi:hypothetical protein
VPGQGPPLIKGLIEARKAGKIPLPAFLGPLVSSGPLISRVIAVLNAAEGQNKSEFSVLLCETLRTQLIGGEEPSIAGKRKFFDGHLILTSL